MALNDTALLAIIGTVAGQQHIITHHFRAEDPGSALQTLIDDWQAGCRTAFRGLFVTVDNPCQLYRASWVCGTTPLPAPVEESETVPLSAGTSAATGERLPSWLAVLVNNRTALAGRSRRGRNFYGGLYEGWANGNDLLSAVQANYTAYNATLISVFGSGGSSTWRHVVHSHVLAQPGVDCDDSSTPITSYEVKLPLASMKSRKPGRGL